MANMEHVQIVKRGRDTVARWREEHPGEVLDLNASYLSYARIPQVDLSGADIRDSDLMGATLPRANLSGARLNPVHMYRADMRQANVTRALLNGANLRGANLAGADFSDSDLDRVVLSDANLTGCNLSRCNLSRANLTGANLTGANLTSANLNRATLTRTNLTDAVFEGSDFYEAIFNNPEMGGANFHGGIVGYTVFQNCDFSGAVGLDLVRHDGPSTIGIDSLYRSKGLIAEEFLRNAGVPESLAGFQASLVDADIALGDCFISCTDEDEQFATILRNDLQTQGVRCWVFSEGSRGSALVERHSTSDQEEVERWVRLYDKMVVVCSANTLESENVRNDLRAAQELQQSKDEWVLFLAASDTAFSDRSRNRQARNIAMEHLVFNLQTRDSDSETYQQELAKLADGLKQTQPASAGVPVYDMQL